MVSSRSAIFAGLAGLAVVACVFVALSERHIRSPTALLEGGQKLYYYPGYYNPYAGYGGYDGYGYSYPYGYGYGYWGYPNYPYHGYDSRADADAYNSWLAYAANQQYQDGIAQQQAADFAQSQQYVAQVNAYNQWASSQYKPVGGAANNELKVAKDGQKLVYLGDLEFGGYRHDITGGNDGGYNAPFDINGDGQYIDNWAKVTTQWKHKKGSQQLKQKDEAKAGAKKPVLKQVDEKKPAQAAKAAEPAQMLGAVPSDFVWQRGYKYLGKYQGGSDQIWHRGYDVHPGPTDVNPGIWKNHPGPTDVNPGIWKNHPGPANGGIDAWKWYKGPQAKSRTVSLAREEPSDMMVLETATIPALSQMRVLQ